jgi:glucokinase
MSEKINVGDMKKCILALDIGGTFIKSGLVPISGEAVELTPIPVDSNAEAEEILQSFTRSLSAGMDHMNLYGRSATVFGVGIAIPGPFDYAKGISLMTHKFASIYKIDLASAMRKSVPLMGEIPVRFSHDANSFLTGEMWRGAGEGFTRVIGITLGTGLGVAASIDGRVLTDALGSPADDVSLWDKPYKNGTVEDAVSTRAMLKKYREIHPEYDSAAGIKGIADAAMKGDGEAVKIFTELGEDLANVLMPLASRLKAQRIIIGGQIAKSFSLFAPSLEAKLKTMPNPPMACRSQLGALSQLYGAASALRTMISPA